MPEVHESSVDVVQLDSAGEAIYTDGDDVWLWPYEGGKADAYAALNAMRMVEKYDDISEIVVGTLRIKEYTGGGNTIHVYGTETSGRQNTNADELEDALHMVSDSS
jgi:hypothetical protein